MSRKERDTIGSHLETVLEHLLKLELSNAGRPRRGWLVTADKQRAKFARKLTTTTRTHLEAELPALYGGLQRPVAGQLEKAGAPRSLPPAGPYTLEPALDPDWFPKNVHGIEDPVFETMLLIPCPWCGERDETEFHCGGEAHIARPVQPAALSDEEWADYLFMRSNPKGIHFERWRHVHGCGRWFNLARDTIGDRILQVYPMGAPRPRVEDPAPARPGARPGLGVVGPSPDEAL